MNLQRKIDKITKLIKSTGLWDEDGAFASIPVDVFKQLIAYKPKVKPLQWHKSGNCEYAYCLMDNKNDIEMVYEVSKLHEQSYKQGYSLCTPTDDDHTVYSTEDEAKAAAQAHFEKFILGWLE